MHTHICTSTEPDPYLLLASVVAKHIADNLTCGNPVAADLARSLQTELDAAGVNLDHLVSAELGSQADEQRAAGA